jgi:polysaccharide pyruvyl transferase CsaB
LKTLEKKIRTFIFGYYGAGNIGDELILEGILKTLPAGCQPVVASRNPREIKRIHGVTAIKFSLLNLPRIIWEIFSSDRILIGGGDLFQEVTSRRSLLAVYLIFKVARLFGKFVGFLGISLGEVFSGFGKRSVQEMVRGADLVISRFEGTQKIFEQLAPGRSALIPGVDWAFLSAPDAHPGVVDFSRDFPVQKIVGLSVRPWFGEKKQLEQSVQQLAEIFQSLLQQKMKLVFLPFQFEKDKLIEEKILKYLKPLKNPAAETKQQESTSGIVTFKNPLGPQKMWAVINGLDVLIGMRLHSLIMASILRKPIFSLSYTLKNSEFMEQLGLTDYQLSLEELDFEKGRNQLEKFFAEVEKIRDSLQTRLPVIYQKAESNKIIFQKILLATGTY